MKMIGNSGLERLLMVRSEVEQACLLLASPSAGNLDRCATVLESACSELVRCRPSVSGSRGSAEAWAEACRLQDTIRRASRLLQNGQDYFTKWSQAWGARTSGYSPRGEGPAPARRGLVSVTG